MDRVMANEASGKTPDGAEAAPAAPSRLDVVVGQEGLSPAAARAVRPFLQVYFRCSNTYQRVYRNASGDAYVAACAKCGKQMRFRVGPGGTGQRRFEVSC